MPRPVLGFEVALLAGVVLLVKARHSLGLPVHGAGIEQVTMVALFLVVAVHLVWLLKALAEKAAAKELANVTWPFFIMPLLLYLVILPWSTSRRELDGDEPYFLLIAHSLAYDFDAELTNNYANRDSLRFVDRALEPSWADPKRADGRAFSRHSPLLPLLLAPGYRLGGKLGALTTMALMTALASGLAYRLGRRYWPENGGEVIWAWALFSLTPPLLLYSHQIWVEVPAMMLLLVALGQLLSLQEDTSNRRRHWVILAAAVVLLPALKLRFALLTGPLLVLAWWRTGRNRKVLLGGGFGLLLLIGGLAAVNHATTGKWLRDHSVDQLIEIQAHHPVEYLTGAAGLFWDCAFGLFAANPSWLLLIPALLLVIWQRRPVALDLLVLGLPYLAVIAPRAEWYGAWSPPFRFGIVLLPLLAMALVPLLACTDRIGAHVITGATLALGTACTLLWLAEPGWTYNLATGTNHLLDHLASLWSADVARFFPSMVRPRVASWLVPLLAGAFVTALWWWPRPRTEWRNSGVALALLAVAAVPLAAHRVPTHVIEFEDRQVTQQGGSLYPEPWTPYRPRFRGGWRLTRGDWVSAPVVSGGERLVIELQLRPSGRSDIPPAVSLLAGETALVSATLDSARRWQTVVFEGLDWIEGEPLVLRLDGSGSDGVTESAVVLDRATLHWK
jgi:hypothetical protein